MDRGANDISRRGGNRHSSSADDGGASAAPLWPAIMVAICSGYLARGNAPAAAPGLAESPARWTPARCRAAVAGDDAYVLGGELWDIFGPALAIDDLSRIMAAQLPRLTGAPGDEFSAINKRKWRE